MKRSLATKIECTLSLFICDNLIALLVLWLVSTIFQNYGEAGNMSGIIIAMFYTIIIFPFNIPVPFSFMFIKLNIFGVFVIFQLGSLLLSVLIKLFYPNVSLLTVVLQTAFIVTIYIVISVLYFLALVVVQFFFTILTTKSIDHGVFKLAIVDLDGEIADFEAIFKRNLIKSITISFVLIFYIISFFKRKNIIYDSDRKLFYWDIKSNTRVVEIE